MKKMGEKENKNINEDYRQSTKENNTERSEQHYNKKKNSNQIK